MNTRCDNARHAGAIPTTLWLSLRLEESNWLFDFAPTEERAVVVGSAANATVRLERRGVAPIHFHFEREDDRVRLIPGYGDELWVNGTRVHGAQLLDSASQVDFAGLRLEVHFFAIDSDLLLPVSARIEVQRRRPRNRPPFDIPDPLSATRVAFRAPRVSAAPAPSLQDDAAPPTPCPAEVTPAPRALRTEQLASEMQALSQRSVVLSSESGSIVPGPASQRTYHTAEVICIEAKPRKKNTRRALRVRVAKLLSRLLIATQVVWEHARTLFFRRRTKALSADH